MTHRTGPETPSPRRPRPNHKNACLQGYNIGILIGNTEKPARTLHTQTHQYLRSTKNPMVRGQKLLHTMLTRQKRPKFLYCCSPMSTLPLSAHGKKINSGLDGFDFTNVVNWKTDFLMPERRTILFVV